jgi:peptide-methionine (S)-S-oxide reductase
MMNTQIATLAGGCFWCVEAIFVELNGVLKVISGYSGGFTENPTYKEVCADKTGHAETIQVEFDSDVISYEDLLRIFFTVHDPTTRDRQGNDIGRSYRSAIFYHNETQQQSIHKIITEFTDLQVWPKPIVTEVEPFTVFYPAEDYHQEYFNRNPGNPYCSMVIQPKVAKFRKVFMDRLK